MICLLHKRCIVLRNATFIMLPIGVSSEVFYWDLELFYPGHFMGWNIYMKLSGAIIWYFSSCEIFREK